MNVYIQLCQKFGWKNTLRYSKICKIRKIKHWTLSEANRSACSLVLHSARPNCFPKPEKLDHGETTGANTGTDSTNLTFQTDELGAWKKPTGAKGITQEFMQSSVYGPMALWSLLHQQCRSGMRHWGTEPDQQKATTHHLQGCSLVVEGLKAHTLGPGTHWCWPMEEMGAKGWRGKQDRGSPGWDWWKFHTMESKVYEAGAVSPPTQRIALCTALNILSNDEYTYFKIKSTS